MISIIISSRDNKNLVELEQNIANTIGVQFEIIKIDNPGLMGICEAYNKGAQRAKYDILCFAHEDIEFKTQDWGKIVLRIFKEQPEIGLLGVAGNIYKSISPSHWSFPTANESSFFVNAYAGKDEDGYQSKSLYYSNPTNSSLQYVATIDGFWFCVPKEAALEFPFDEIQLKNFHGYDVDYSLIIQQKYKVAVTFEILIQHYSWGTFDKEWIEETIKVHEKWKDKLPLLVESFAGFNQQEEEKKALIFFMKKMVDYDYNWTTILKNYQFQNKNFHLSLASFLSVFWSLIFYKYLNHPRNNFHDNKVGKSSKVPIKNTIKQIYDRFGMDRGKISN